MVIIDSEESKSPHGPRPVPQPLAPPPYSPLSPTSSALGPPLPPRSPGLRPTSPFSAPASNFLTIKRDKADITGTWNINTSLSPPPLSFGHSCSSGSDREFDLDATSESGTNSGTDNSGPTTQASSVFSSTVSASVPGSAARPNLKLFTPKGKIDAAIRVSGVPRAWIEAVSRDEDVAVTFPPNSSGAQRAPIKLLVRSTSGNVQVNLPQPFMGTLRVPYNTVLPPSLRSQSVVLSPSEPPIDRPPILDEPPTKAKMGLGLIPSKAPTPTPPSPIASPPASETAMPQSPRSPTLTSPTAPASYDDASHTEAPQADVPTPVSMTTPSMGPDITPPSDPTPPASQPPKIEAYPMEEYAIPIQPPVETPAQEHLSLFQAPNTPPPESSSPAARSTSTPILSVTPAPSSTTMHYRSPSVPSTNYSSPSISSKHHRSASFTSTHPIPAPPTHDSSEASTIYFIGDLLHSGYNTNAPEKWTGDEFVIDSERGRVRVCVYGEKAEVPWTEDVTSKVKDAMDWHKWKNAASSSKGLKDKAMQLTMPKISVGSLGRRLKFGK
ncbi:hypothetical protein CTheo_5653 [Ceratobasidium theobromae]|uniref:DUF7330 domain-containing protein n=1 Tax=Ceratobasidium theobromae TaxID=1582974 RepID=A0A5N5QHG6_9AGAM|nr:hypothetical protein CTheo_5653 [Ceratobasidium theobromae]